MVDWILRQVIDPAVIWFILLIWVVVRGGKVGQIIFAALTLLGSSSYLSYLAAQPLESYAANQNASLGDALQRVKIKCQNYQGVIALGGVIPNLDYDPKKGIQTTAGSERLTEPVALYKICPNLKLIFTSFGPQSTATVGEAELAKIYWQRLGVKPGDIKIENKSTNTYENAINTKALLKDNGRYLLVSSAAHLKRADEAFTKAGVEVDLIPVDFLFTAKPATWQITPLATLNAWRAITHEYIGIYYYRWFKY
jgi:uncharacterized SAM-binding protein YcdF (DUF218 family)